MIPSLLADAEKVMRTNQRLSATLRRLLDTRAASDRQRVARVISDIRNVATELAPQAPVESVGATVDEGVAIAAPFSPSPFAPVHWGIRRGRAFPPIELTALSRWSGSSRQFAKPRRQGRAGGFVLVLKEYEHVLPVLPLHLAKPLL